MFPLAKTVLLSLGLGMQRKHHVLLPSVCHITPSYNSVPSQEGVCPHTPGEGVCPHPPGEGICPHPPPPGEGVCPHSTWYLCDSLGPQIWSSLHRTYL